LDLLRSVTYCSPKPQNPEARTERRIDEEISCFKNGKINSKVQSNVILNLTENRLSEDKIQTKYQMMEVIKRNLQESLKSQVNKLYQ